MTPDYWVRHVREAVRFADGVATLQAQGVNTFLEIGPKPVLLGMAQTILDFGFSILDSSSAITQGTIEQQQSKIQNPKSKIYLPSLREGRSDWQQMLESLGALYVTGVKIDWAGFEQGYQRHKVVIPTYPFQRQRYWIEREKALHQPKNLRPLITKMTRLPRHQETVFESEFSVENLPFLADHRVFDAVVSPAACHLAMLMSAAELLSGEPGCVLKDVIFPSALVIPENSQRTVQLIFSPSPAAQSDFELLSFNPTETADVQSSDNKPLIHATGQIHFSALGQPSETLTQLRATCPITLDPNQLYERAAEQAVDFGANFRWLEHVWHGEGEALAQLKRPEGIHTLTGDSLHPGLLDACFQLTDTSSLNSKSTETALPFALDTLHCYQPITGESWWAHVRQQAGNGWDIRLLDQSGKVLLEINGFRTRTASSAAIAAVRQRDTQWQDWLYTVSWQAQPLVTSSLVTLPATTERPPETSTAPQTWLLFAPPEAPAMALAAQLQAQGKNCVLVTAGQAYALKKGLLTAETDTTGNPSVGEIVCATLNPLQREEYDRLFQDLAKIVPACEGIVYLWGVNHTQSASVPDMPATVLELCSGLLHLLQALNQTTWKPRLWLVTQNSQAVAQPSMDTAQTHHQLSQVPLWGLARTIMAEHPEIVCRCLDFDNFIAPDWPTVLFDEVQNNDNEPQIAYRQGVRHVARLVHQPTPETIDWVNQPSQVRLTEYSSPDNLHILPFTRRQPAPNEVEIQVQAAGLNFRDVLNILGMLQSHYAAEYNIHHAADLPLGFECAGVVVAVGTAIHHLTVGDRVMAMAEGSFASFVTVHVHNVAQIPEGLTFEEAATIPLAFLTAYQALHGFARLQAGERVLIHAAAGGVGQAAVQIAQAIGAEVYATTHPNKWGFLQAQQIEHLYNSRTADFAKSILEDTQGRGVDVVLNSLNGDLIEPSFQVMARQGRFVEIGKLGIWSADQVRDYRPDIAYYPFELGDGATDKTTQETIPQIFAELMALFAEGKLKPLPHRVFPIEEIGSAVHVMQQAKQRGKLVLSFAGTPQTTCHADGSYLITGGLGGLGLQAAQSLVEAGAKHLILAGRRTALSPATQNILEQLQQKGVDVTVMQADVAVKADVQRLLTASQAIAPLRGIIHAAGVLDDGILLQQRVDRLQNVMDSKVTGAWHLHQLSQTVALDFFVCFSSMSAIVESAGQGNYAAANAFLDALMIHRQNIGLPGLSLNWGPWADVGMAADRSYQQQGITSFSPAQGGQVLLALLRQHNLLRRAQIGVQRTDWPQFFAQTNNTSPFYAQLAQEIHAKQTVRQQPVQQNIRQQIESLSLEEQRSRVMNHLEEIVRNVLGLPANHPVNPQQYLMEMGLDSLMAIEFRNHLMRSLDLPLPAQLIFDYPTLNLLHTYLLTKLFAPVPASSVWEAASTASTDDKLPIATHVSHEDMLSDALNELCLSPVSNTLQLPPWTVRPAVLADVSTLSQLEREAYGWIGEDAIASPKLFADRIELLNSGDIPWFWVMEHSGEIIGWQVLQPTPVDPYHYASWAEATDHGTLAATFDPHGANVYIVGGGLRNGTTIAADHIMTLQTLLMLRAAGCHTAFFCSAMPGYAKYYTQTGKSPEEYLALTDEDGIPLDEFIAYVVSSWPVKPSFRLLRNGYPPDKDSGGHGVSTVFKLTDFESAIQEVCERIVRYADLLGLKNR
jgi:NADPH:quinone reductase-like Zn-dependent oxidoreductase